MLWGDWDLGLECGCTHRRLKAGRVKRRVGENQRARAWGDASLDLTPSAKVRLLRVLDTVMIA